jgi:hypothetical protein
MSYIYHNGRSGSLPRAGLSAARRETRRFMAIPLPPGSALKKPLDSALIEITASAAWRRIEAAISIPLRRRRRRRSRARRRSRRRVVHQLTSGDAKENSLNFSV